MVPIVEPEVLMDGNHSAEVCFNKTSEVIKKCFEELILHKVDLSGIILKPNMILAGSLSKNKISNQEVSFENLNVLKILYQMKFLELLFYLEVNLKLKLQKI